MSLETANQQFYRWIIHLVSILTTHETQNNESHIILDTKKTHPTKHSVKKNNKKETKKELQSSTSLCQNPYVSITPKEAEEGSKEEDALDSTRIQIQTQEVNEMQSETHTLSQSQPNWKTLRMRENLHFHLNLQKLPFSCVAK